MKLDWLLLPLCWWLSYFLNWPPATIYNIKNSGSPLIWCVWSGQLLTGYGGWGGKIWTCHVPFFLRVNFVWHLTTRVKKPCLNFFGVCSLGFIKKQPGVMQGALQIPVKSTLRRKSLLVGCDQAVQYLPLQNTPVTISTQKRAVQHFSPAGFTVICRCQLWKM